MWVLNSENHPELEDLSQWRTILVICVIFSAISSVVVGLRLWLRYHSRGWAWDDNMAFMSLIFGILYSILCIFQTRYGLGLAPRYRPVASLDTFMKLNFAGRPIYQFGISFFKLALLISYLRLFKGTNQRSYVRTVWLTLWLILLGHLASTLSLLFACKPIHSSWTAHVPGKCLPIVPSFASYSIVSIISDIVVALLPLPAVYRLNVSRRKKVGLAAVFVLGVFTTICSVLRYLQIHRIQYGDGNSTMLIVWGVIEFNVGNCVSSLPFLAPVFLRKAQQYRSYYAGYSPQSLRYRMETHKGNNEYRLNTMSGNLSGDQSRDGDGVLMLQPESSQENMTAMQVHTDTSILKSTSYSVNIHNNNESDKPLQDLSSVMPVHKYGLHK